MVSLFTTKVVVFKVNKLQLLFSLPLWVNDGKQRKNKENGVLCSTAGFLPYLSKPRKTKENDRTENDKISLPKCACF